MWRACNGRRTSAVALACVLLTAVVAALSLSGTLPVAHHARALRHSRRAQPCGVTPYSNLSASTRAHLDTFLPFIKKQRAARGGMQPTADDSSPELVSRTYLAFCIVTRDEGPPLYEWLMYHHTVMQVERFYVFDNNSTVPALPMLQLLIQQGVVVYEYFTHINRHAGHSGKSPQPYANHACMKRWGHHHEWMALIDTDEYFVIRGPPPAPGPAFTAKYASWAAPPRGPLAVLLSEYEGAGGLAVSWVMFGSSGNINRTKGILGYYTTCMDHDHIKTIVSTHLYAGSEWHPHNSRYHAGAYTVDVEGVVQKGFSMQPPKTSRLALFHYGIRSEEDYRAKVARGDAWRKSPRDMALFYASDAQVNAVYAEQQPRCSDLDQYKDCFVWGSGRDCSAGTQPQQPC